MDSNQPARTRQMAITRKTGPRSGIGKATSESERNDPIRAQIRGSDPSAVSLGLNRSKVRLNSRTTNPRPATREANSTWLSMPWPGSQDINSDLTSIALSVAKTPIAASRDALPKTSLALAIRKDSVTLRPILRAPSLGRDEEPDKRPAAMIVKVVLQGAFGVAGPCSDGRDIRRGVCATDFGLVGLMFQCLLRPGASGLDYGLWCRLLAQGPHRGDSCNNRND